MNESCREMTHEELKISHMEISKENENLKITNELLIVVSDLTRLKEQFIKAKDGTSSKKKGEIT